MTTASHLTVARAGGLFVLGILFTAAASAANTAQAQDTASGGVVIVAAPSPIYTPAPPGPYASPYATAPAPAPVAPAPRHSRAPLGLTIAGAVVLGVGWLVNIIPGLFAGTDPFGSDDAGWDEFRIASILPVAGPWLQLALKPTDFRNDAWGPWLIANGIWQGAGTVLLIAGIATMSGDDGTVAEIEGVRFAVLPTLAPDQMGLTIAGTF